MASHQRAIDLTGETFGGLKVLCRVNIPDAKSRHASWLCRCKCGKEVIVQGRFLRNGTVISCGCVAPERKERGRMRSRDMEKASASLDRLAQEDFDPYQNLANAIVAVAADDYRTALRSGNHGIQSKLEEFFLSSWCKILTDLDCDELCKALRMEHRRETTPLYP